MRVELLSDRAGTGSFVEAGSIVDLPDEEAKRLIRFGQAVPAGPQAAAITPTYNAAKRHAQKRG